MVCKQPVALDCTSVLQSKALHLSQLCVEDVDVRDLSVLKIRVLLVQEASFLSLRARLISALVLLDDAEFGSLESVPPVRLRPHYRHERPQV